jgi:hypothetical protein
VYPRKSRWIQGKLYGLSARLTPTLVSQTMQTQPTW